MTSTTVQMSVPRCHCLGNPGLARLLFFIIFLGLLTSPTPVSGQVQTEAVGQVAEEAARRAEAVETSSVVLAPQTAPIVVDGRFLFNVRGISAYPAEERARIVADRITAFAADTAVSVDSIELVDKGAFTAIAAGDRLLMGIHDLDSQAESIDRQILAQFAKEKIAAAIRSYRHDREPRVLLVNTAYAAAATGVLVFLIWATIYLTRRLERKIEARYRSRVKDFKIQSFQIAQATDIWIAVRVFVELTRGLIIVALLLVYTETVLSLYPWTRPIAEQGVNLVINPLRTIAFGVLNAVPSLVFIFVVVLVTRYLLKLLRLFFAGLEHGTVEFRNFEPEWAWPTYKIVRFMIIAFAAVVCYPYIPGSESNAFKGISIFLGVIFSLGSSSAISNIIAGYTMTYRRAFKVGDRIQVGEVIGEVIEVRLQVTHLRTPKNEEVIIPNSSILDSHVVNYSSVARESGLILHTTVGIGYETPWRQVEAMLLQAAERTPGLKREPKPFVLEKSLGDFCVVYELNVYTDQPHSSPRLYAALHRSILDLFNEYGVQIMTPAYEGDPEEPKLVPKDKWFELPAVPEKKEP